jgi:hypothetical protein
MKSRHYSTATIIMAAVLFIVGLYLIYRQIDTIKSLAHLTKVQEVSLNRLKDMYDTTQSRATRYQQLSDSLSGEAETTRKKMASMAGRIGMLVSNKKSLEKEVATFIRECNNWKSKAVALTGRADSLASKIDSLAGALDTSKTRNITLVKDAIDRFGSYLYVYVSGLDLPSCQTWAGIIRRNSSSLKAISDNDVFGRADAKFLKTCRELHLSVEGSMAFLNALGYTDYDYHNLRREIKRNASVAIAAARFFMGRNTEVEEQIRKIADGA